MTINSATIVKLLQQPQSAEMTFDLLLADQQPCRKITLEEARTLALNGYVCARWRGNRIRSIQLLVPPDIAFRSAGEKIRSTIGSKLGNDANQTTQRASQQLPSFLKKHHAFRCSSFGRAMFAGPSFVQPAFAQGGPVNSKAV